MNYKKLDFSSWNWKEIIFAVTPLVPSIRLVVQYTRPKEKRNDIAIKTGYIGTAILLAKLTGFFGGYLTIKNFNEVFKKEKEINLEKKVNNSESVGETYFHNEWYKNIN